MQGTIDTPFDAGKTAKRSGNRVDGKATAIVRFETIKDVGRSLLIALGIGFVILGQAIAGETRLAVATNFKPVIDELTPAFNAQTGHRLIVSNGSTGLLYAQIQKGAPFDVFLAADQTRPRLLEEAGLAIDGSRFTYAVGRLVLWSPTGGPIGPERLKTGTHRHLAIANPELAPYGAAAMEVLTALGLGVPGDPSAPKLILGENIGQTFAFLKTGNAELGFVSRSQLLLLAPSDRGTSWEPPQKLYSPIRQDGVLLARAEANPAALALIQFLKSESAQTTMHDFGYTNQ